MIIEAKEIKVSIIIPVYNVQEYLRECLNSLCNQTLKEIEIITIDDGSTDDSKLIIDEFKDKDNRIIYHYQENQGQGIARNWGIENARGEFLGFVDSDDFVDINMFYYLYYKAIENDAEVAQCSFYGLSTLNHDGEKLVQGGKNVLDLISQSIITIPFWNKIFRKEIFIRNNVRFPLKPVKMKHQDFAIFICPIFFSEKIFIGDRKLYHYRVNRTDSIMNTISKTHIEHLNIAFQMIRNFIHAQGITDKDNVLNRIFSLHVLGKVRSIFENGEGYSNKLELYILWNETYLIGENKIFLGLDKSYGIINNIYLLFSRLPTFDFFLLFIVSDLLKAFHKFFNRILNTK